MRIFGIFGVLALVSALLFWKARGPSGASEDYGGSLEAALVSDFPTLSAERWVNGAPQSLAAARGSVVLIEAWAPG